jgi:hypothetical protein
VTRLLPRRRGTRVALVLTLAAVISGSALAYFTTTGSGAATARVGTAATVSILPATPTTYLYPGGSADVAATFDNATDTVGHVPSLVLDTSQGTNGFSVDSGHSGCDVSTLSFTSTPQNHGGAGWDVPAKSGSDDGTLPVTLTNAVSMGVGAANACQGAQFKVYLKAGS